MGCAVGCAVVGAAVVGAAVVGAAVVGAVGILVGALVWREQLVSVGSNMVNALGIELVCHFASPVRSTTVVPTFMLAMSPAKPNVVVSSFRALICITLVPSLRAKVAVYVTFQSRDVLTTTSLTLSSAQLSAVNDIVAVPAVAAVYTAKK